MDLWPICKAQLSANGHLSWVVCHRGLTKHNFEELILNIGEKVGSPNQMKDNGNESSGVWGKGWAH